MLKLFHAPQSRSSRIIWLLEEIGTDYQIRYASILRMDGSGARDRANPHPNGKVPALIHDGALITESAAIVLYLTDLFPKAGMGPTIEDDARGAYLSWLAYYAGVIEPLINVEFAGLAEHPVLNRTFRGRAELDARILGALQVGHYLLGDRFSAADILIASIGHWVRTMLPADSIVDDWLARCGRRPALEAATARDAPCSR